MASADQEKGQRTSAKGQFTRLETLLKNKLDDSTTSADLITSMFADLRNAWENVNSKHDLFLEKLQSTDEVEIRKNDKWICEIQERLYDMQKLCDQFQKSSAQKLLVDIYPKE